MTLPSGESFRLIAELVYHLDREDRIALVNDAWTRFASANRGESLAPPLVLERPIWDFVADAPTRHIYRVLYARVRSSGETVRLNFRCDAPDTKRLLQMNLSALGEGGIACCVRTLREQPREPLALLDPTMARGDEWIRMCSWCKRIAVPSGAWIHAEEAVNRLALFADRQLPQLTHGICGDCDAVLLALVDGRPQAGPAPLLLDSL